MFEGKCIFLPNDNWLVRKLLKIVDDVKSTVSVIIIEMITKADTIYIIIVSGYLLIESRINN